MRQAPFEMPSIAELRKMIDQAEILEPLFFAHELAPRAAQVGQGFGEFTQRERIVVAQRAVADVAEHAGERKDVVSYRRAHHAVKSHDDAERGEQRETGEAGVKDSKRRR